MVPFLGQHVLCCGDDELIFLGTGVVIGNCFQLNDELEFGKKVWIEVNH